MQRRNQKLTLQKKLKELRKDLRQAPAESLGSSQKTEQLALWDPFDSQASANFFDPHWMFGRGLSAGFDIVIGNPPYISVEKFSGTPEQALWKEIFTTYAARARCPTRTGASASCTCASGPTCRDNWRVTSRPSSRPATERRPVVELGKPGGRASARTPYSAAPSAGLPLSSQTDEAER